jgi:hypothetical protein
VHFANTVPLQSAVEDIEYQWIDPKTGLLADAGCPDAVQLPFSTGSAPVQHASCVTAYQGNKGKQPAPDQGKRSSPGPVDWFKELFE